MPKGKKATIQAHASARGESVNSFINRAIDHVMVQEAAGSPTTHVDTSRVLPNEASKRAPTDSEGRTEGIAE